MLWPLVALLLIMLVAGAVVLFVAYPSRGEEMPYVPALGEKMRQAADAMPVLTDEERRLLRR